LWQKIVMTVAVAAITAYACKWINENMKFETKARAIIDAQLKDTGILGDPGAFLLGYNFTIGLLAVGALAAIWFVSYGDHIGGCAVPLTAAALGQANLAVHAADRSAPLWGHNLPPPPFRAHRHRCSFLGVLSVIENRPGGNSNIGRAASGLEE
jgi:hypothetical protein